MGHGVAIVAVGILLIAGGLVAAADYRSWRAGKRYQGWSNLIPLVLVVAIVWAVFGGR